MKRVLFFGIYDPAYARSIIVREGFEANGYEVVECRVDARAEYGARKYLTLFNQGRVLRHESFEHILVLFPGHTVVWLARLLFGRDIIFDAFVSLYDSNVDDRKRYAAHSFRAYRDRLLDWSSCLLAHTVLVDTDAQKQYFIKRIGVPGKKLIVVPVGASKAWFDAGEAVPHGSSASLRIGFYGSYIPLHGVEHIVRAADILRHELITFEIIGDGQEYARMQELVRALGGLPNVMFLPKVSRDELIVRVQGFDMCLGIFGTTEKASRVIPNKVYECAALGKPIITADTPGIREMFTQGENIFLCANTPAALARAIMTLAHDDALRTRLGREACALLRARFSPKSSKNALDP